MSQFKALSMFIFIFIAQNSFAGPCEDFYKEADALCIPNDEESAPNFVPTSEVQSDDSNQLESAAQKTNQRIKATLEYTTAAFVACKAPRDACIQFCEREAAISKGERYDDLMSILNDCQNDRIDVGGRYKSLEIAMNTASALARRSGVQVIKVSGSNSNRSNMLERTVGPATGFTGLFGR